MIIIIIIIIIIVIIIIKIITIIIIIMISIIISILISGFKFCDLNSSETAASLMLWLCMPISGGGLKFCDS